LRLFSCRNFFNVIDKDAVFKKFHVKADNNAGPCEPDFMQPENDENYSPEMHLIKVHGFLSDIPGKSKRTLEIELCRLIEDSLTND